MATFLEILQTAADEMGLTRPADVQSPDPQTRQLAALANREGAELMKAVDWTDLQTEFVIEFGAPVVLTGDLIAGSKVVTNIAPGTSGLVAGAFAVSGQGIQVACRLAGVDSPTQVTLTESSNITAVGAPITFVRDTFNIPTDFDRYIDQTHWDRRFQWALIGPVSPQVDEWQRSGVVATGPRRKWRQVGRTPTAFRIWPPPAASGDTPGTLAWEYISNQWVSRSNGTFANKLVTNDDTPVFPDGLMVLGVKWRFFQIKGFSYAALQAEYLEWVGREKARKGGKKILDLTRRRYPILISPASIQDGSFPGPGN